MARLQNRLTNKEVRDARHSAPSGTRPSRLPDGGGLYLQITPSGAKSWLFTYRWGAERPELGLGPFPAVGLADARRRAEEARVFLAEKPKRDPRSVWAERATAAAPAPASTFGEFVDEWLPAVVSAFRNPKHQQQWKNTLETYAAPIWSTQIDAVDAIKILEILQPIWNTKRETAQRLRGRIERVLDAAKAKGLRTGENPARWRGHLSAVLANQRPAVTHFKAMPYPDVPAFMAMLAERQAISAKCLRFLILTATRSGEARGARWEEIDLEQRVWTIPSQRMKAGRPHRVPLSDEAMDILEPLSKARVGELVFPGQRIQSPLSETAFRALFARADARDITTHGFRSAFRDWCGETTTFPREVAEQALAHTVGDKAEQAYRRGDALEKRRKLMQAWAAYCSATARPGKLMKLRG